MKTPTISERFDMLERRAVFLRSRIMRFQTEGSWDNQELDALEWAIRTLKKAYLKNVESAKAEEKGEADQ